MDDEIANQLLTQGQRNKYYRTKEFFEKLIKLSKQGVVFSIDGEIYKTPFIDGFEMGFKEGNFKLCFLGNTYCYNKSAGEYDIPWVDVSMKELRERIILLKKINTKYI